MGIGESRPEKKHRFCYIRSQAFIRINLDHTVKEFNSKKTRKCRDTL